MIYTCIGNPYKLCTVTMLLIFLDSVPMVVELIDQVLALHPGTKLFHIGGDEVKDIYKSVVQTRRAIGHSIHKKDSLGEGGGGVMDIF